MGLKRTWSSLELLLLLLLLAMLLAGCDLGQSTARSTDAAPDRQQVLRLATHSLSLDPAFPDYPAVLAPMSTPRARSWRYSTAAC